jgi:putative ABC transport system permease protein
MMKRRERAPYIRLAFKNLGRYKGKTIITMSAVFLTVFLFIALDSYFLGSAQDIERYTLLYESGSARIVNTGQSPVGISDYETLVSDIEKMGYNAAPRARLSGTIEGRDIGLPITLLAVDPEKENTVFYNHKFLTKGRFVRAGSPDIVIGNRLARDLDADIGDIVRFTTQIETREPGGRTRREDRSAQFRIGGILNTPNVTVNMEMGFTALDLMQGEDGMVPRGQVTEICLRDKRANERDLALETEELPYVKERLQGILPSSFRIVGWEEDARDFLALAEIMKMAMWLTLPIFLVLGLLGIFNTMSIAVRQRGREIGMLRSMGMRNGEIIRLFLYESGLIGVIGTALGLALGLAVTLYMIYVGIDITSSLDQGNTGYAVRKAFIMHSAWSWSTYAAVSITIPLFCALSALLPSQRALKADITRAIRMDLI